MRSHRRTAYEEAYRPPHGKRASWSFNQPTAILITMQRGLQLKALLNNLNMLKILHLKQP
ncbi:hypothetical protein FVO58_17195 [Metabacillus halosaccharovorans]|nr:hypothetical protein [Metabacillus halosaccharovorans]